MSETEIKVPNIGDFKDVEVIEVLVTEGQSIKKNDALITIESDKSSVEIPSNAVSYTHLRAHETVLDLV